MTKNAKRHAKPNHEHSHKKSQWHKDWKTWTVVGLMLAAMVAYVMSDDEAIQPGESGEEPIMPAATE